jgi:23S rRNA pseudouridine2605 synthase
VPLERALSKRGLASRAQARVLIAQGRVRVNGRILTNPLTPIVPERAIIAIDGETTKSPEPLTIALHKPRGYVTTRSDPEGRLTVYNLLADLDQPVVPVGRLDLASSGLLILTTDTQLANWLTDPESEVPRVYLVTVEGRVTDDTITQLARGILVDGERLAAASAVIRKASTRESHLTLTLHEGKNREIRRMLTAAGHPVTRLRRVQFGGLDLGPLAPGKWRRVSNAELQAAFPNYSARSRAPRPK